jgi:YHS domain-containing protein
LFALFWLVMAAAGLIVELLFSALGLVPTERPEQVVHTGFQWNYTTYLNIVFLVVFGVLLWLAHNRRRLGGGEEHATDPVCGMQVERAAAPATAAWAGTRHWFCSDHCRDRFLASPEDYGDGAPPATAHAHR